LELKKYGVSMIDDNAYERFYNDKFNEFRRNIIKANATFLATLRRNFDCTLEIEVLQHQRVIIIKRLESRDANLICKIVKNFVKKYKLI
jgi:hypothetical protein